MPPDDEKGKDKNSPSSSSSSSSFTRQANRVRDFFSIPAPVKRLFDKVPVLTYAPNELPQRTPKPTKLPTLYVFIKEEDAAAGRPSFNPGCLKWQVSSAQEAFRRVSLTTQQAFLKIAEIQHRLLSSNNHASPTGVLPFLLPSVHSPQSTQELPLPIPSNKLVKFALDRGSKVKEPSSMRYEAYQSLLDHRIRNAWVRLAILLLHLKTLSNSPFLSSTTSTSSPRTPPPSHSAYTSTPYPATSSSVPLSPTNYEPPPKPSFSNMRP
jgi:metaxin